MTEAPNSLAQRPLDPCPYAIDGCVLENDSIGPCLCVNPVSQEKQEPPLEVEIVRLINVLRADEGDSVTILCDNPDFNGQPNCAIECCMPIRLTPTHTHASILLLKQGRPI